MATTEVVTGLATAHFHDLSMTVGRRKTRGRSEAKLQLELDDGSSLTVNTDDARLMPNVEESAQFGELVESFRWMEIFMHAAPGDGVKTRVAGIAVDPGDSVAVRGVATREFTPGDGYRDTGDSRIAGIDAQVIAALTIGYLAATGDLANTSGLATPSIAS